MSIYTKIFHEGVFKHIQSLGNLEDTSSSSEIKNYYKEMEKIKIHKNTNNKEEEEINWIGLDDEKSI